MYAPILAFVFFYNFGATIEPIYMYWVMEVGHVNELSLAFIRLARYVKHIASRSESIIFLTNRHTIGTSGWRTELPCIPTYGACRR
jgi:hypothetical protein